MDWERNIEYAHGDEVLLPRRWWERLLRRPPRRLTATVTPEPEEREEDKHKPCLLRPVEGDEELTRRIRELMLVSFIQGWRRGYAGQPRGNWTPELARASLDLPSPGRLSSSDSPS